MCRDGFELHITKQYRKWSNGNENTGKQITNVVFWFIIILQNFFESIDISDILYLLISEIAYPVLLNHVHVN